MKKLYCVTPGVFEYAEDEYPQLQKDHAIIKIRRIGICGTDLHAFRGTQPFFNYPRVLGHELAGEPVEADNIPGFKPGDKVTIIPYYNCGHCIACRNGKPNCCTSMAVCGVHIDGGMAEYLQVPGYALVQGGELSLDELALVEPLAIGAHGVRRAEVRPDEYVLVIGAGPIGMGIMEFARIAGARVIAMDINQERLEFCRDNLQVNHIINSTLEDVTAALERITQGDFPTVVIDATGNLNAINEGFGYMAHGARYVLVGLQKGDIGFSHPEFHKRESTLLSSRNATRQDFEHVIACMQQGLVKPTNYITHRTGFNSVASEFESWLNPANGVIKAMVSL